MRIISTLAIFLFSFSTLPAQNLKGVWQGTFEQNSLDPIFGKFSAESYKYEVQINHLDKGALEGVTYSYLTTVFYGKASLKGIFDKKHKTLIIKETVLVEVKSTGRTEPCLMTCYLDYAKNGNLETLIGTYSSVNIKTKTDCGTGTVYLERVEESDFEKENFLKSVVGVKKTMERKLPSGKNFEADRIAEKKRIEAEKKNAIAKSNLSGKNIKSENTSSKKVTTTKPATTLNNIVAKSKAATQKKPKKIASKDPEIVVIKKEKPTVIDSSIPKPVVVIEEPVKTKKLPAPIDEVLKIRENKLANIVFVDSKEIVIEFYDNGDIDNDSISVYKDNKLVVNNERLSTKPIVLNLKFDDFNTFYELITVAENLGDIPPNTALMVINYGKKRQEVFLTSDDKRNAKVVIQYQGK